MSHETYTITFGDSAENHVGMQKIGEKSGFGFSKDELLKTVSILEAKGYPTTIYCLNSLLENTDVEAEEAYLLISRGGVGALEDPDLLLKEQKQLKYDTHAFMRGRVVNKRARYNLCFGEASSEPDYENGKGRIVSFSSLPHLFKAKKELSLLLSNAKDLVAEGNFYYDIKKCGIGFHGDSERMKTIGLRLGASMPLHFQWYVNSERIGDRGIFLLNHGDLYIMSEKANGNDWKKKKTPTLRHAAGCEKYLL